MKIIQNVLKLEERKLKKQIKEVNQVLDEWKEWEEMMSIGPT